MRPIVLLLGLVLAACSSATPVASASNDLHVQNSTTVLITIVVNGGPGVRVAPGVVVGDFAGLPALPWTVEALTESGATLATMSVGSAAGVGSSAAFPLSCGSITMWIGPAPPAAPPTPDSSALPDCGS